MEIKEDEIILNTGFKQNNPNELSIHIPTKPKSKIIIGELIIENKLRFNKLQKFMWKFLLNIKIEDVK